MVVPDVAAVVLAGGRSTRMGEDKVWLEWQGEPLLSRTCALLAGCLGGPLVVVRSQSGQQLPPLPGPVRVVEDPQPGLGPLLGIAAGLAAVGGDADVAFVCATDLPLLRPELVRLVVAAMGDTDGRPEVAVPVVAGAWHPLAAAYRTVLADAARAAASAGNRRVTDFVASRRHLLLDEARLLADPELAATDPHLQSVLNVNDPVDLARARAGRRG